MAPGLGWRRLFALAAVATGVALAVAVPLTLLGRTQVVQGAVVAAAAATSASPRFSPFSLEFQAVTNAYTGGHGLPPIRQSTCLRGRPEHYVCSFVFRGTCRLALVDNSGGEAEIVRGARARVAPDHCFVRGAMRSLR